MPAFSRDVPPQFTQGYGLSFGGSERKAMAMALKPVSATMLAAMVATFLLSYATTYPQILLAGLGVGLAGGSFAVGIAYVSKWFPQEKQGTALGFFGMGNVGAAVTKFGAPFVMVAFGWTAVAQIWAGALAIMATDLLALARLYKQHHQAIAGTPRHYDKADERLAAKLADQILEHLDGGAGKSVEDW